MEYIHTEDCQIRADIAFRLGKIALQYENNFSLNFFENFQSTLHISILQTLLTNCLEILKEIRPKNLDKNLLDLKQSLNDCNYYEIKNSSILSNNLHEQISLHTIFVSLRNALSHPTNLDLKSLTPSTGYTTIKNGSNIISDYIFIDSPDVKNNRPKRFNDINQLGAYRKNNPKSILDDENLCIKTPRIMKIKLNVSELKTLITNLSIVLSQPVQKKWDKTFNPFILTDLKVA
jgi:hypothetical protein